MAEFDHTLMDNVLNDVAIERERQVEKWGDQIRTSDARWLVILGEEYGESCQALLEIAGGSSLQELEAELIQVAAVAVAHVEAIRRRDYRVC